MKLPLLAVVVAACGGSDVDLTGMYRVETAVESEPCGTDGPAIMPPAFLRFTEEEFFGRKYFSMDGCTDMAGTDCSGGGLFGDSFAEPIDDGWRGVTYSSSGVAPDTMCRLFFSDASALLKGGKLVVEGREYAEQVENTMELCSTDEAERRGDSMPCIRHEKLEATKL